MPRDFVVRREKTKKTSFKDLPANLKKSFQDDIQNTYEKYLEKQLQDELDRHAKAVKEIKKEIRAGKKFLKCKHQNMAHLVDGIISDNSIVCQDCGHGWSDR